MSDDEQMELLLKRIKRKNRKRKKAKAAIELRLKRLRKETEELGRDSAADETTEEITSAPLINEKQIKSLPFLGQIMEYKSKTVGIPKVFSEHIKQPEDLRLFLWMDSEKGGFARRHQRLANGVGKWLFQLFSCSDITEEIASAALWKLSQYLFGEQIPKARLNNFYLMLTSRHKFGMPSWVEWKPSFSDVTTTLLRFGVTMPTVNKSALPVDCPIVPALLDNVDAKRLDCIIKIIFLCVWRGHHHFSCQEDAHRLILLCCRLVVDPHIQKYGIFSPTLLWEAVLAKCDTVDIHSLAKQISTLFSKCGRALMCSLVSACPKSKNGQLLRRQLALHALSGDANPSSDDKILQIVSNLQQTCVGSLKIILLLLHEALHNDSSNLSSPRESFKKQLVPLQQIPRLKLTADKNVCEVKEILDFLIHVHKPRDAEHRVGAALSGF